MSSDVMSSDLGALRGALGRACAGSGARSAAALGLVLGGVLLAGCSGTIEGALEEVLPAKQEYKSTKRHPPLEIPPDLSSTTISDSLPVPEVGTTYSDYASANQGQAKETRAAEAILPEIANARIERSDDKRWLVVYATPGQVWPRVREFFVEQGFTFKIEDPSIGILETDWAEDTADAPQGALRTLLSRVVPKLGGAWTRDKFRVRLERGEEAGTTEIYVSHRGAEVKSEGRSNKVNNEGFIGWQPRPSDPELEAEMLARLMVTLGAEQQAADRMLAVSTSRPERARMVRDGEGTALALAEDFSRAWRRTGLALDRVGFTVEDRDRSRGLYYVRYVDPDSQAPGEEKEGWLSKLKFWGSDDVAAPDAYLISLVSSETITQVVVLDKSGQRDTSPTADRILALLHEQLK